MKPPEFAVARSVCAALLRELSGFRGYPREGEDRFIDVLQQISISVDHARAVVYSFEENFPTIREMRDVAMNLQPKFKPPEDMRAKWEAQYGKPQPVNVTDEALNIRQALNLHELPDAELWRKINKRVGDQKTVQRMSWVALAALAREFGYPEYAEAWERSVRHGG